MMKWLLALMLLPALGHTLALEGRFTQGGWLTSEVPAGAKVKVDGVSVPTADGRFFFGLHRHYAPTATVSISLPEGQERVQTVLITPRTYQTQHIKGVTPRKVNPNPEDLKQIRADSAAIKQARSNFTPASLFTTTFAWPTSGTISGVYGSSRTFNGEERSWHKGLDIAAPTGTPIVAPAPAKVALALPNSFFNGNLIVLDHGQQVFTIYAHLDSLSVATGQHVAQGQNIGTVGSTGRSTGPHLHWGLYWRNIALDPRLLLEGSAQ